MGRWDDIMYLTTNVVVVLHDKVIYLLDLCTSIHAFRVLLILHFNQAPICVQNQALMIASSVLSYPHT